MPMYKYMCSHKHDVYCLHIDIYIHIVLYVDKLLHGEVIGDGEPYPFVLLLLLRQMQPLGRRDAAAPVCLQGPAAAGS